MLCSTLLGCAQVRPLTGGEKDVEPPKLVEATPPSESTNVNVQRIVLRFDERIQLRSPRDRVLISPPLPSSPTFRMQGAQSVLIEWEGALLPNTTYSFQIGDAVLDLAEGNPAAALTYVLSTGPVLDRHTLHGRVIDAFTGVPVIGAAVQLYEANDRAEIDSVRPIFLTRSDARGDFSFLHLPPRSMRIRALVDKNANYLFDLPNEKVAFLPDPVVPGILDSTSTPLLLRLFQEEGSEQFVKDHRITSDGALVMRLSMAADSIALRPLLDLGSAFQMVMERTSEADSLLFWPTDTTLLDGQRFAVLDHDLPIDTLRYNIPHRMPFHISITTDELSYRSGGISLQASRPIDKVAVERIYLKADSGSVIKPTSAQISGLRKATIEFADELIPAGQLVLLPNAIQDLHAGGHDTLFLPITMAGGGATGDVSLKLGLKPMTNVPLILQVVDGQGIITAAWTDLHPPTSIENTPLIPGAYTMRIIIDENANEKWDTGDLGKKLLPEATFTYPESVNIRAGWHVKLDWLLEPALPHME